MSAKIKRFDLDGNYYLGDAYMSEISIGEYVEYTDHLASHAYDEAVERGLFEARFGKLYDLVFCDETEEYESEGDQALWYGWKACAKSRASRARNS